MKPQENQIQVTGEMKAEGLSKRQSTFKDFGRYSAREEVNILEKAFRNKSLFKIIQNNAMKTCLLP